MERKLLLLGLLRVQEMHGYQLNEIVETHLGVGVQLTKPTAYRLLNEMADDSWITYKEEREGNRPPRRVYAITSQGEAAFQRLLRESLADYKPAESHSDISLAFLDVLPGEEALSLLSKRRSVIANMLESMHTDQHHGSFQLVIEHTVCRLATELEWLDKVIDRIERAY